jgi:hypothetical protein
MEPMLHPLEQAAIGLRNMDTPASCLPSQPAISSILPRTYSISNGLAHKQPNGEEAAARNLKLLAAPLEQNLIERRVNPDACKPLTY